MDWLNWLSSEIPEPIQWILALATFLSIIFGIFRFIGKLMKPVLELRTSTRNGILECEIFNMPRKNKLLNILFGKRKAIEDFGIAYLIGKEEDSRFIVASGEIHENFIRLPVCDYKGDNFDIKPIQYGTRDEPLDDGKYIIVIESYNGSDKIAEWIRTFMVKRIGGKIDMVWVENIWCE